MIATKILKKILEMTSIPEVSLGTGSRAMPILAMGTAMSPLVPETVVSAVLHAIQLGYRHFDTAFFYRTEEPLGEAIAEALRLGLIQSRSELFITSKLWPSDGHRNLVVPALQKSLRNLRLEYLDLYLLHWPLSAKPGTYVYPFIILPMDFKSVWEAMEECQRLGLAKSIGVSNFTCKKLTDLLATAKIPPAVNQVEMSPIWQQKKLLAFCKNKGIHVTAYSPLGAVGAVWGTSKVMDNEVVQEISKARGKTFAQVSLRWVYQQGACPIVKSFNKERMGENLDIFDWELDDEEMEKISHISQLKITTGEQLVSTDGPFKSLEELWDGEI